MFVFFNSSVGHNQELKEIVTTVSSQVMLLLLLLLLFSSHWLKDFSVAVVSVVSVVSIVTSGVIMDAAVAFIRTWTGGLRRWLR